MLRLLIHESNEALVTVLTHNQKNLLIWQAAKHGAVSLCQEERARSVLWLLLTPWQFLFWCNLSRMWGGKDRIKLEFSHSALIFMCLGHLTPIFTHACYCGATGTCRRANLKHSRNRLGMNTDQRQMIPSDCPSCANCKTQTTLFYAFATEKLPCPWHNVEICVCSLGCLKILHF